MGKPGVDALDSVLLGTCPLRPVRRARLRHERMAGRRPGPGSMGCGSRGGHRRGRARRAGDAARHLAGRGYLHPLCDSASGTRGAADPLRRLRPRGAQAGDARHAGGVPRHGGAVARGLGKRQSDVPAGVHVALHSRRHPRAAGVVQRSMPEDHLRRGRGGAAGGAGRHGHRGAAAQGPHADAGSPRAERRGRADRRRTSHGQRHPGRRVRGARFAQPHPARAGASLAAVLRGGAGVPRAEGRGRPIRRSRRCRHESVRCWR